MQNRRFIAYSAHGCFDAITSLSERIFYRMGTKKTVPIFSNESIDTVVIYSIVISEDYTFGFFHIRVHEIIKYFPLVVLP